MSKLLKTLIVEDSTTDIGTLLESFHVCFQERQPIIDTPIIATSFEDVRRILNAGNKFDVSILDINLDGNKEIFDIINEFGKTNFGIITLTSGNKQSPEKILNLKPSPKWLRKPFSPYVVDIFLNELEQEIDIQNQELIIEHKGKRLRLEYDRILFIQGDRNNPQIAYLNNTGGCNLYSVTETLLMLYERLDPTVFYQCQKSYIINVNKIVGCEPKELVIYFDIDGILPTAKFSHQFTSFIELLKSRQLLYSKKK